MKNDQQKIIIDTDPGVDDALAIAFGVKAGLPIEAISTVYGNSTVENSSMNALTILELAQTNIPVYSGAEKPIKGKNRFAQSHGDNGLGGFNIESERKISDRSSLEFYQEVLEKSESGVVTIVSIGPTTNIGELITLRPDLFQRIGKLIIMGGVFGEKGNITPFAEFNVFNDPYSLKRILEAGNPGTVIVPANICRQVIFTNEIFNKIQNIKIAEGLSKISKMYINYYSNNSKFGGFSGGVMYDLLAVALAVMPDLFTVKDMRVRVETDDEEKFGETRIVSGKPNCQVVTGVEAARLKLLYVDVMNRRQT